MNRNVDKAESFTGNFAARDRRRQFFDVPHGGWKDWHLYPITRVRLMLDAVPEEPGEVQAKFRIMTNDKSVKAVSLDVFDSTLTRTCGSPEALFLWLGRRLAHRKVI